MSDEGVVPVEDTGEQRGDPVPPVPPAVPRPLRIACAVLALEALALLAAAGFLLVSTVTGDPSSIGRALFGAVFAALGAVVLAACARSLWHLHPAARTPAVILQLLSLPVSYSLAFQAERVGYGGPIFVAALTVLYLLFTPPVREVLDREPPGRR